ncbi:DUF2065 family protein [Alphaproteobacteria bacterium KMM 3653]|uniref:DUF2065 family protein n=1 Tax=Harenicola maris TaxID=2841044 RepID=A0AAP2G8B1_9RHOB|nr:DUF2065 family protein [Harenicola maris]
MAVLLLALGLVCVLEGLVLALMPGRLEELLEWFSSTPLEARRLIGLIALCFGAGLVALSGWIGG